MNKNLRALATLLVVLALAGFVVWYAEFGVADSTADLALFVGVVSAIMAVVAWFIALRNS